MARRRRNDLDFIGRTTRGLVGAGVGLGVGATAVGDIERKAGVTHSALPAFTTASGFLPTITTAQMGMGTLKLVKRSFRQKKRR